MSQYVGARIVAAKLEIAVFGRQPPIHDLEDLNRTFAQPETQRFLFPAVTGIAGDADGEWREAHGV